MSHKFASALIAMALISICTLAVAQENDSEPEFKLLRDSATAASELELESEEDSRWEPAITAGTVEVSFFLGFLDLKSTLLSHEQIIYKYNDEATFWGDVALEGESAFCPGLRLGYNFSQWLSVEGVGTISFSEYSSTATNRVRRSNETGSVPDFDEPSLGEFDLEARSLITGSIGINAVVYPFNISGDAKGRFHPFVTGGAAAMWYDMNSNYTDGASGTMDMNIGGGIRLLADRNISIRLEALFHHNSIEFSPAEYFRELNEGTTLVPLNEYPTTGDGFTEQSVASFESVTFNSLSFSLGIQGSF